jgi:transketolase
VSSDLTAVAAGLRRRIVGTSHRSAIPHLGSCLSCIDLLVHLYWKVLRVDPNQPDDPMRDRFILSKGHGAPALFQVLGERGFFPESRLDEFGVNGSVFHEHPPAPSQLAGIEAATGSLGHGFSMALGMALAGRMLDRSYRCIALLSDGECNEGSVWEAAMLAAARKVDNLCAVVDFNGWQATGRSREIMHLEPLKAKWEAFGWHAVEIDGHNFDEMDAAFAEIDTVEGQPSVVIAQTVKGRGVSFMEDDNNWHYRTPDKDELDRALAELDDVR